MKIQYVRPEMKVEEFLPNNHVAACSDKGEYVTYEFKCDATGNIIDFLSGNVYLETNGQSGLQKNGSNPDTELGGYKACSDRHTVTVPKGTSIDAIFQRGYLRPKGLITGIELGTTYDVRVWRGENNDNIHCTKTLNTSEFEIIKS